MTANSAGNLGCISWTKANSRQHIYYTFQTSSTPLTWLHSQTTPALVPFSLVPSFPHVTLLLHFILSPESNHVSALTWALILKLCYSPLSCFFLLSQYFVPCVLCHLFVAFNESVYLKKKATLQKKLVIIMPVSVSSHIHLFLPVLPTNPRFSLFTFRS